MRRIFSLILLEIVIFGCSMSNSFGGLPEPTRSDYFTTKSASIALRLDDQRAIASCSYSLLLTPRQTTSHPLYLRTLFENPMDSSSPLATNTVVQTESGDIHISSPEVRELKSGMNYRVEVLIFDAPDRVHQIGQHIQYIRFTKPSFVK